jgi:phosphoglycolate phosphatase
MRTTQSPWASDEAVKKLPLRAVLFDLDGTLLDTPRAIASELAAAIRDRIGGAVSPSEARRYIGLPLPQMIERLTGLSADSAEVARIAEDYRARFRRYVVPAAPTLLFPGVRHGLQQLRDSGLLLAVVTSKQHDSALAILDSADILHLFSDIVGCDDTDEPKPSAQPAVAALDRLGVEAHTAVAVGDTVHDISMGLAVPMRTLAVTYGVDHADALHDAGAHRVVDTFDAVTHLLISTISDMTALEANPL